MDEIPDHPHQASIHLMKALRCCRQCHEPSEELIFQIQELEIRKQLLANELRSLRCQPDSILKLKTQILEIEQIILELQQENVETERMGLDEIKRLNVDRQLLSNSQKQGFLVQLNHEKHITKELTIELQSLFDRVKYLNRINNQIIYNFCRN